MARVVVIGGGISGLASARGLADRLPDVEVVVLEAGSSVGGPMRTQRSDGFTFEVGPHSWLNRHPSTLALAVRLGLEDRLVTGDEKVRRRYVLSEGRLARFPDSPSTFLTSDLLSVRARLRMLLEPLMPHSAKGADESVDEFARRRLGREAAALLVEPVAGGIYAGDPRRLSLRAALPQLGALEDARRSLLGAYLESRRRRPVDQGVGVSPSVIGRRRLVSFQDGLGSLVDALAESLGPAVRTESPVRAVLRDGSRFRVVVDGPMADEIDADAVVSAAPAPSAAAYLADLDPDLTCACSAIPHAPLASVALGFREADVPHPLDGFGYLVSGRESGSVLGVHFSSSLFPGMRSPSGAVAMQAILGGARDRKVCERDDDALVDEACDQLQKAIGVTAAPVKVRVWRHARGLPQYEIGHHRRRQLASEAAARYPGFFLTGNAWSGVGMNACTQDAERVVDGIAAWLRSPISVSTTVRSSDPVRSLETGS